MSRFFAAVVVALVASMGVGAQDLIFEDGFEWGSTCAWDNDLWFSDVDGDLFGDHLDPGVGSGCPAPLGTVDNNLDCDDAEPLVNPDALEMCEDLIVNDCDTLVDCDDSDCFLHPSCALTDPVINEVCYDNDGTDDLEFIELYQEQGNFDLTGYTLVHYNGANGVAEWAIDLSGVTIPADGHLVIGDLAVENLDVDWTIHGVSSVQNSEESLVLYSEWDGATGTVIDAVGWGIGAAVFVGEGSPAPEIEFGSWNNSIGRHPDGTDTDDNSVDFEQSWWPTPGEANTPAQPAGYTRLTYSAAGATPLPASIPDNDVMGVALAVAGPTWLGTTIADLHVGVRIQHGYIGDLQVSLESPVGSVAMLHDRSGGSANELMTVYDLETASVESLDVFNGENPQGFDWTLLVSDNATGDTGEVLEWILWVIEP